MRYLTKSLFKLAMECPTKLYYVNKEQYDNQSTEDSFLEHLADGGYQVNELAKQYFPSGNQIKSFGTEALNDTKVILENEKATIFEAAVKFENYYIRIDILEKIGNRINIIEVKSKSIDPNKISFLTNKGIRSGWEEYLYDIAFQKFVFSKAYPQYEVSAFLMLVDKEAKCPTGG